jgi:hypothetical protein
MTWIFGQMKVMKIGIEFSGLHFISRKCYERRYN